VPVRWRDIRVGDVLKVLRNEPVPADAVFLAAGTTGNSGAAAGDGGASTPDVCFVQTAQLDGETNLKRKRALQATAEALAAAGGGGWDVAAAAPCCRRQLGP